MLTRKRKVNKISIITTNHSIAETIVGTTQTKDQQILILDAMQSITSKDVQNGTTYLSVMENNLNVLTETLNKQEIDIDLTDDYSEVGTY